MIATASASWPMHACVVPLSRPRSNSSSRLSSKRRMKRIRRYSRAPRDSWSEPTRRGSCPARAGEVTCISTATGSGYQRVADRSGSGHQVVDVRIAARFGADGETELAVRVRQVELDGLLGHPELAGDSAVRVALGDEAQDLQLATGERAVDARGFVARGGAGEMHDGVARDLAQERAEADGVDGLGDHRLGAGLEDLLERLVVHPEREEDALGLGGERGELAQPCERVFGILRVVDRDDIGGQL